MPDNLLTISGPVVLYDSYKMAYRILRDKENWKVDNLPRLNRVITVENWIFFFFKIFLTENRINSYWKILKNSSRNFSNYLFGIIS